LTEEAAMAGTQETEQHAARASAALADAQAIRAYLEQRRAALIDEVRHYPTPIARCDVQLPALLEARTEVLALLALDDAALGAAFAAARCRFDDPDARDR
jgi:hypothetical protein